MKHTKALLYLCLPALSLGLVGVSAASAYSYFGGIDTSSPDQIAARQQILFQREADLLGISVDEVKNAWAAGTSMQQLMTAKGVTEAQVQAKMKELQIKNTKTQLQAMVGAGLITQAQADQRLQTVQTQFDNRKGPLMMGHLGHRRFRL